MNRVHFKQLKDTAVLECRVPVPLVAGVASVHVRPGHVCERHMWFSKHSAPLELKQRLLLKGAGQNVAYGQAPYNNALERTSLRSSRFALGPRAAQLGR